MMMGGRVKFPLTKGGIGPLGGLGTLDSDDDFYSLKPTCHSICQVAFPAVQVLGKLQYIWGMNNYPVIAVICRLYIIYDR